MADRFVTKTELEACLKVFGLELLQLLTVPRSERDPASLVGFKVALSRRRYSGMGDAGYREPPSGRKS